MTTDNFCFYLQNRLIQTSKTGGQWYSDTPPFSIPWLNRRNKLERLCGGFFQTSLLFASEARSLPERTTLKLLHLGKLWPYFHIRPSTGWHVTNKLECFTFQPIRIFVGMAKPITYYVCDSGLNHQLGCKFLLKSNTLAYLWRVDSNKEASFCVWTSYRYTTWE